MTHTPTPEQQAIIEAAQNSAANLAVVARAGAAKTSTLVMIAEALPRVQILCLAFNKAIAVEMAERLPKNCEAKTLHSIGFAAWRNFIRCKTNIADRKMFEIVKSLIGELKDPEEKTIAFEELADTLDIIRQAKAGGYLPEQFRKGTPYKSIDSDEDFFFSLPMEPSELQRELVQAALIISFQQALKGTLDFDDMIYCPALSPVSWPTTQLLMVDEAQDLSALNHLVLRKIVKRNRIIAVGDPFQAIYGFRGADTKSLPNLIQMFDMEELRLTVTFRCGKNIAANATWRAPDLQSPDWQIDGEVHRPVVWRPEELQQGDAIICRNNAPLFSMAIRLIKVGLLPEISGRDMVKPLSKIMNKLGSTKTPTKEAIAELAKWKEKQLSKARDGAEGKVHDTAACIKVIFEQTATIGDAIAYLEHLMSRDGRIHLMTGHKSKGLEFDRVWFLNQHLCRVKDHEQDANLKYVIETRAKKYLAYVSSDSFEDDSLVE